MNATSLLKAASSMRTRCGDHELLNSATMASVTASRGATLCVAADAEAGRLSPSS